MDYTRWAKDNKKSLVQKIINKFSTEPQEQPYAVFIAGIPGAGKTELLDRLFDTNTVVRIDLDEIVKLFPNYSPDKYYAYRGAANIILDEVFIYCRKHKLNFVIDGTFGHKNAIGNIEKALKRHDVLLLYVYKDPLASWKLTQDREVVTNRAINREGFINSCVTVPENVRKAMVEFANKIEITAIKKDKDSHNFKILQDSKEIDDLLKHTYTKKELEKIIL